ncbi:MAG: putative type II secretion system protein F [bacterium ADurb.Bin400]|nr:MAG: putative type II secretion system protein F [bacterium ADurb.Bin400]
MQFNYVAKGHDGKVVRGSVDASDEKAVVNLLKEQNLYPISLRHKSEMNFVFSKKIALKDKIIFTQQLALMIRSGLPIVESLKSLREEAENKSFAEQLSNVIREIEGGAPLSAALSKYPKTFNEIYVNMVKSGERTGKVDEVLERLTVQLVKDYDLNRKVHGALAYPVFVLFVLAAVMALVLVVIIPQLQQIFIDAGVELPLLTRIVIKMSEILKTYGLFMVGGGVIAYFALMRWKKTIKGRHFFDTAILKIPVIGLLLKKSYMARFTRTFAALAASGLPLMEVFKVTGGVIGNILYEDEITRVAARVKNGETISKALRTSPLFPTMVSQLATVGEKSGSIDQVFNSLADFFDRDVDNITSNLSTMLEPMLIVVMGIGIGGIIISVLQPIYGLVNAV